MGQDHNIFKPNNVKRYITLTLSILFTLFANAKFEVNGLNYEIISEEEKTVEVTYQHWRSASNYLKDIYRNITIPSTVTYDDVNI